jgi:hypothetical protein
MKYLVKATPLFLFLLPVFFVLHGFIGNYNSIPVIDALLLTGLYILSALVIAGICWLFSRDLIKAGLIAFLIMAYQFFFGSIQDLVTNYFPGSLILRYRFILPASLLVFFLVIIWLKRRKKPLLNLAFYLNMVLLVIILADIGWLITKMAGFGKNKTPAEEFSICDTCRKPDIFFIITDQYSGETALKKIFNFDNTQFENKLQLRGFHIAKKSSSNYNLTPFSIASTLNMDYLTLKNGHQNYEGIIYSYEMIRNSRVLKFLMADNYRFYNCSIFDFEGQPAHKYAAFLHYGTNLITSQTFTTRLLKDFHSDILKGKFGTKAQKGIAYEYLHFNDNILNLTRNIAAQQIPAPKFVYTHLMMPHYPYYFDSKGNPLPLEKLSGIRKVTANDYIEYLKYTNGKLLELVDDILATSPAPPVIILLGDHGFQIKTDHTYDFMNLNAVYFPDRNYSGFYDSITNVNQFRVVLNTFSGQHFPLLKDSTINVWY